jgi:Dolichyl-phosphate-mannose-protein mannosyltransferase
MSESAQATRIGTREIALPSTLARRWLPLGVGAAMAGTAGFLLHQLLAWPPHEDETLALFVGRHPLGEVFQVVLEERGGAPLHFLFAWALAHLELGLGPLRLVSTVFAVASLPLVALLGLRLAGRKQALLATVLVSVSWMLLFHGVYGRMYSLFLFTSALSYVAFLRAVDRGSRRDWVRWVLAILATVATHPYGALVLATQGLYVVLERRDRRREALLPFASVALLGTPFWLSTLVLAGRFDVGVGGGGAKLGSPLSVLEYLWRVAGAFTAAWWPVTLPVLVAVAFGLRRLPRRTVVLSACVVAVPTVAFLAARVGNAASPETRHLIFVLPFFAIALAAGILRLGRLAPVAVVALLAVQIAWAWERTPALFEWEPSVRQAARAEAATYLAQTSRSDDVLFGYEPLYLGAWERNTDFPLEVLPRADANLALEALLELDRPLGRGLWIFDASANNNISPRLHIRLRRPRPAAAFEVRRFGPFLVIRTRARVITPERYLERAGQAMLVGKALWIGDADINLVTVERAARRLRGYGAARSLSTSSR